MSQGQNNMKSNVRGDIIQQKQHANHMTVKPRLNNDINDVFVRL